MASYTDISNILNFSVSFARTSAFPLDAKCMFGSKAAAEAAAAEAENAGSNNTVYYYGMPVYVFENDKADMYIINGDNTLKSVGSATYGDDKSIVLDASAGKLSLKSFGEEYYAYHEADETHTDAYYEKVTGWKEGLQPRVIGNITDGYSLAWYEPSTTTVEGLSDAVGSLQTSMQTVNEQIGEISSSIDTLNGDINTEGSIRQIVNDRVSEVIGDSPEAFDTLKEFYDWTQTHSTEAMEMSNNITANATAINALKTLIGELPDGSSATTIIEYIAEAVDAEKTRAKEAEAALEAEIASSKQEAIDAAAEAAAQLYIPKTDIVAADSAAASVETASDSKVPSEKLMMTMLTWKTTM